MKIRLFGVFFLLVSCFAFGQKTKNRFLGSDVLQLPSTTFNANYSIEAKPYFTAVIDLGYTINYIKSFDFIGNLLTSHCDCANLGYEMDNISGGYFKFGGYYNLRNDFKKHNYFHLGVFLTSSIVHENGYYTQLIGETLPPHEPLVPVSHTVFVPGLNFKGGFVLSLSKKWAMDVDFQVSLPGENYNTLYGYRNYIPGMGYRDVVKAWYPMLICNLKYRL